MPSRITPQMRGALAGKMLALLSVDGGIPTGPDLLPAGATLRFRLGPPEPTGMGVTDLFFVQRPERTIITGDSHPVLGKAGGLISDAGYGVGWFGRRQGEDYLAEKFLRTDYHPQIGREWLEGWLESVTIEDGWYEGTPQQVKAVREVLRRAGDDNERYVPALATYEAFRDFLADELGRDRGDIEDEGCGYDPDVQGWLAAIQSRFATLYSVMFSGTEREQRSAVEYAFWVQYHPTPGEERAVTLSMEGNLRFCSNAFLRHLPPKAPYAAEELARRGLTPERP